MTEPQTAPQEEELSSAPETESSAPEVDAGQEAAGLKDQLLRALAEAENTRRRAQKERDETAKYAVANFARDMLGVADNFNRALEAIPKNSNDPTIKNLITGIEATGRQLQGVLERFGIREMSPLGQPFDPNFHRVMMEIDDPDQPPGTVVQVLQPGYVIHDRLLREALVAVSKGATVAQSKFDTSA